MRPLAIGAGLTALTEGFQQGATLRRQRMMDELAAKRQEQEAAFRSATEARLLAMQQAQAENLRVDNERQASAAEQAAQGKRFNEFMAPLEPYTKGEGAKLYGDITGPAQGLGYRMSRAKPLAAIPDYDPTTGQGGVGLEDLPDVQEGADYALGKRDELLRQAVERAGKFRNEEMAIDRQRAHNTGDRVEATKMRLQWDREKTDRLSDKQTENVAHIDTSIARLGDLVTTADALGKRYPGAIGAPLNMLAQKINVDDPEVTTFVASARNNLSEYVREISGLAATDAERGFLATVQPNEKDSIASLRAKATKAAKWAETKRRIALENYRRQGNDVSEFSAGPVSGAPAASLSPKDQQAKAWAEANPGDPRATKILQSLKARGL